MHNLAGAVADEVMEFFPVYNLHVAPCERNPPALRPAIPPLQLHIQELQGSAALLVLSNWSRFKRHLQAEEFHGMEVRLKRVLSVPLVSVIEYHDPGLKRVLCVPVVSVAEYHNPPKFCLRVFCFKD